MQGRVAGGRSCFVAGADGWMKGAGPRGKLKENRKNTDFRIEVEMFLQPELNANISRQLAWLTIY